MKYSSPRDANVVLDELLLAVQPGRGISIALTERTPDSDDDLNWIASAGVMSLQACDRFSRKVALLRQEEPRIDWSKVKSVDQGQRRVSKWLSEVPKSA